MAKDRIEFRLIAAPVAVGPTAIAAQRAFGLSMADLADRINGHLGNGMRIQCTPAQFGRFIAFRVEEGVSNNRIQELEIKYIKNVSPEPILDVSGNDRGGL